MNNTIFHICVYTFVPLVWFATRKWIRYSICLQNLLKIHVEMVKKYVKHIRQPFHIMKKKIFKLTFSQICQLFLVCFHDNRHQKLKYTRMVATVSPPHKLNWFFHAMTLAVIMVSILKCLSIRFSSFKDCFVWYMYSFNCLSLFFLYGFA